MSNNCVTAKQLFEKFVILDSDCEMIFSLDYPSEDLVGFQGGCSDGERYYYLAIMHYDLESNQENNYSKIAKIDIKHGKVIKWSERLSLHHANDIAYNPIENILVVCNNKPHKNWLTVIDADSLKYIRTVELPFDVYCIEYNNKRNGYVVGLSGSFDFTFLDASFNSIDKRICKGTDITSRYTKQGMCADDDLIYFILWDSKHVGKDDFQNEISVYDWNGNFCGLIEFDIGEREPENISIINGELYAVCCAGNNNPGVYRIIPKPKE